MLFITGVAFEAANVLVAGSYNSVLLRLGKVMKLKPPAISTLPPGSNVAVSATRALFISGVAFEGANVLVAGSYNSVLLRTPASPKPPAISTLPSGSSVAVAFSRAAFITGVVAANVPDGEAVATRG